MTTTLVKPPKFQPTQWVGFVGGKGIVRSFEPDATTWTYLIEMPLGAAPDFGRVGAETMVYLNEADLRAIAPLSEANLRAA